MNELNNIEKPSHQFLFQKASLGRRLGAYLIDYFILSNIFVFVFVFGAVGVQVFSNPGEMRIGFYIFSFVIVFLAFGFRDIFKGQSIGKRILGIGVRDVSDNFAVPSASRLFLRQIFTCIWLIEFFVLVFNSENRKLGDMIAGTGVYNLREYEEFIHYTKRMEYIQQSQSIEHLQNTNVATTESYPRNIEPYKPKKTKIALIIAGVMLAGMIFIGVLVFGITSMFRNHPSYHLALDSIKANPEIVAVIGEIEGFGMIPMGNLSTSPGRGDANYNIRVRGAHGEVRVFVELQMRGGADWEIVSFNFIQIR